MSHITEPEPMLTPSKAAQVTGLNPRRVRSMCASRQLPCIVTYGPRGRARYLIRQSALTAWIRNHEVEAR